MNAYDQNYWERHWHGGILDSPQIAMASAPPNPHLIREAASLIPGTALDAGCGAGAEAIWLASHGWQVTGADIANEALAIASKRAETSGVANQMRWVQADLTAWEPTTTYDLVTTHYAHPTMPQLDFYDRIASWVSSGGTLLIVGHLQPKPDVRPGQPADVEQANPSETGQEHRHGHSQAAPISSASVNAADITKRLDPAVWKVVTAEELQRTVTASVRPVALQDVVVRATRR